MRINAFSLKVTIIHCLILWRKLSLSARILTQSFACCLYILTNASRHVNLSYYGGLRWRMGCEGRGRGGGGLQLAPECVCVCGHVNLAEAWDEKIHSPIPLSPGDCTSQFTLGGVFRSAAMHLPSKGRISGGTCNRICLFSGNGSIFISPSAEAQARVQWMVWITRYHWIPE